MADLKQLRDYQYWIGKSPQVIGQEVAQCGGWVTVFPNKLDRWASRVRNYFNIRPNQLKLLDQDVSKLLVKRAVVAPGAKAKLALSGDVYLDECQRVWYEMRVAGAIYHTPRFEPGKGGRGEVSNAAAATAATQLLVPVFKLVSPDPLGGSREVCIHNWQLHRTVLARGEWTIGPRGQWVNVGTRVVIDPRYQGSYNYSETIRMGGDAHVLRDVKPHSTAENFYVDPPRFSTLESRRFPARDGGGKLISG